MRIAVVGSGFAAISAVHALLRRGIRPIVIDAGLSLPSDRHARVMRLSRQEPTEWSTADIAATFENATLRGLARIPRKLVFGSDHIYARSHPLSPVAGSGEPSPSLALGGFGPAWGAAVLPAHASDLGEWPEAARALQDGYHEVFTWLPLAARDDNLQVDFPLYSTSYGTLALAPQAAAFLHDLERVAPHELVFGFSRLAVTVPECRYCGYCLSGCVYGAIFDPGRAMRELAHTSRIEYRGGWLVQEVAESTVGATIVARRLDEPEVARLDFDRVFVAAGALNSTRIVLRSLRLYDREVPVRESHKFALPLLRRQGTSLEWPHVNALAALFLEHRVAALSGRWMHVQVTGANDYLLRRLGAEHAGLRRTLIEPLLRRLLIASFSLHSDCSGEFRARLRTPFSEEEPVLQLDVIHEDRALRAQRAAARALSVLLAETGTTVVGFAARAFPPGSSNHLGGSLAMRARPREPYESDTLGRPGGYKRIHVVDGAVLPSIPATTMALPMMANAARIVAATLAGL